jgi:hypothetical protein
MNSHIAFQGKSRLVHQEARLANERYGFVNMSRTHTISHFTPFLVLLTTQNSRLINGNAVAGVDL